MGIDCGDLNRDGVVDFFVVDMFSRNHQKRPEQAVKKEVMVPRIILANVRAESLIFEIDQETKPIQIWRKAGQTNP